MVRRYLTLESQRTISTFFASLHYESTPARPVKMTTNLIHLYRPANLDFSALRADDRMLEAWSMSVGESWRSGPLDKRIMQEQVRLVSMVEGFFPCTILFALLRLRIFEHIGIDGKSVQELAAASGAEPRTLIRLLNAGAMLELLETMDGKTYQVSPRLRDFLLPSGGTTYVGDWLRLQDEFAGAFYQLDEAILKSGPTIDPAVYLGVDQQRTRQYVLAMHNYATLRGRELVHYLDTTGCKTLLDLGCGAGTYAYLLGMRNPDLQLHLADMPEVLAVARELLTKNPVPNQVHFLPLDAGYDEIPGSYDLILVSNMLHCFDAATRSQLLERLYRATNPGGSLVVQAQYLQEDHRGSRWAIFVDIALLCTTRCGCNHTVNETHRWLSDAGFRDIEHCSMSVYGANSFVRGYK